MTAIAQKKPGLFEIADDLRALIDLVDEQGEEIDQQTAHLIESFFAEISTNEAEKLDGYYGLITALNMEASAAGAEAEYWQAKERARTNRAKRLKDRIYEYLVATERKEALTARGKKFALQNSPKALDISEAVTVEALPEQFVKVIPEQRVIDKEAIKLALTAGEKLDFARFTQGMHLRMR